jgi:hypothetical protein
MSNKNLYDVYMCVGGKDITETKVLKVKSQIRKILNDNKLDTLEANIRCWGGKKEEKYWKANDKKCLEEIWQECLKDMAIIKYVMGDDNDKDK